MAGPLNTDERHALADALGDTPETVIAAHLLRRGLCEAWVAGSPSSFEAAVVQEQSMPEEPDRFGANAAAMWRLLRSVRGWKHINVAQSLAEPLGAVIERETGARVRYYGDVYHTLTRPAATFHATAVRELTSRDLPVVEAAPAEVQGGGFGNALTMLEEGVAAEAIVEGRLVGIAHTSAITERHADIGVSTLEPWRGRGFAAAAASIVARRVQERGRIPVWSAGEDNFASHRVAAKVGFLEVSRRVYVSTLPAV